MNGMQRPLTKRRLGVYPFTKRASKAETQSQTLTQPFFSKTAFVQTYELVRTDAVLRLCFITTFCLFIALVIVLVLVLSKLPPALPLLYSLPWGNSQLVPQALFVVSPLLLVGLFIGHFLIAVKFQTERLLLIRLLFFTNTLCGLLLAITLLKIILLMVG